MKNSTRNIAVLCILINAFIAILVFILKKDLPPIVPLFYGLPVSDNQLVQSSHLIIPPIAASILALLNFELANLTKDLFLGKILNALTLAVTLLSAISIIEIILLVGVFA